MEDEEQRERLGNFRAAFVAHIFLGWGNFQLGQRLEALRHRTGGEEIVICFWAGRQQQVAR